ncbi:MAG: glycosyltransferase family 2 protein [Syntrophales bacterium]
MKVSIITVVLNSRDFIEECIKSVLSQTYPDIEHIVIDGGSTDGTVEILGKHESRLSRLVSERDRGIYDAMNKGIKLATGDIIGMLNSDDFYAETTVIDTIVREFLARRVDAVFSDLVYVDRRNPERITRYYNASNFNPDKFAFGWMPPHPTFFARRSCYQKYGFFKTDYKIAADFELLVRFLGRHGIPYQYLPRVTVKMRSGGVSTRTFKNNWILNTEIIRACAENGIHTNLLKVHLKYFKKIFQLTDRPQ